MINNVIAGLNGLKVDIPSWVPKYGGKTFGINIPKIPKLAEGGIVSSPTFAMVGEAGPEAVIPLDRFAGLDEGGGRTANIYVQLDGRTIASAIGQPLVDLIRVKTGLRI